MPFKIADQYIEIVFEKEDFDRFDKVYNILKQKNPSIQGFMILGITHDKLSEGFEDFVRYHIQINKSDLVLCLNWMLLELTPK